MAATRPLPPRPESGPTVESRLQDLVIITGFSGAGKSTAMNVFEDLEALGIAHHVLFLEAAEQTLSTRYKETRRRHPLAPEGSVAAGVASERALLEPLSGRADLVIDTTELSA